MSRRRASTDGTHRMGRALRPRACGARRRTGSVTARSPSRGSIRTSGAGTPRASPWARPAGTRLAQRRELRSLFSRPVAPTGSLPHIVFADGDGRYFPGPEFWQTERSRRRSAPTRRRRGSSSRRSTRPRRSAVYRQAADRERATAFLAELAAEARSLARLPLPRADARRRRPGRDLAPVGVGHGQLPALGRGPRPYPARPERGPRLPARGRRAWPTPRSVRPTASTTATPTSSASSASSTIAQTRSGTRRPSRFSPCCSTRCSSGGRGSCRDRAGRRLPIPSRSRARGDDGGGDRRDVLWDERRALRRLRRRGGATRAGARAPRVCRPSTRGCAGRAPRGSRWSSGLRIPASRSATWFAVTSQPRRRARLRADAILAGPDLADPQLGSAARARPVRLRELAEEVRRAMIDAGRPERFLGALQPRDRSGPRRLEFAWTAGLVLDILAIERSRGRSADGGRCDRAGRGRDVNRVNERRE